MCTPLSRRTLSDDCFPAALITEESYVHSKVMIIDDRRVIIGSANSEQARISVFSA